jgi:zinc finger protein PLAG1
MYVAHPGLSGSSSSMGELAAPGVSAVASVSGVKKKGNHVCPVCSKVFGSPGKLSQHMYSHTGERPFVCSECSKAFSSKFKLVRHALIHSSDSERRYRCNACDRSFHRKDHLQNHAKVSSEFIYDCIRISKLQNIVQYQCRYIVFNSCM